MDVTLQSRRWKRRGQLAIRWEPAALGVFITFGAIIRLVALGRYPPGLHFDEAVYGLLARDILHGARPVFFSAWTGREPLYMYLMAGTQAIVGVNILAIRLTSALIALVTLPLTHLLSRELFNRRVALLATGLIAVNYWHLTVSRNGYPNILIPPLEALSFYFLWRAYQCQTSVDTPESPHHPLSESDHPTSANLPSRGQSVDYPSVHRLLPAAWGGLFAGLVLYTYLAARFYPVALAAIAAYALFFDRRRFLRRLPSLTIAIVVMLIIVAPLAAHFIRNPHDFVERADQVLIFTQASGVAEGVRLFAGNVWQTALAFCVQGDPRWHYNLPDKPIFDPLIAAFFLAGIVIALRRWRELPYAAVLIWTTIMCLPGVLTADLQPAGQRMFGVFPALIVLPALGLDAAWRWIDNHRPRLAPLAVVGGVLLFIWQGYSTTQTYFGDWAQRYETYEIFNGDYAQMAEIARDEMAAGHTAVFASEHYKHPTLAYLAPETMRDAVWTLGERGLVFPERRTDEIVYLVPRKPFPSDSRVARVLRSRAHAVETHDFAGRPAFTVYRLAEATPPPSDSEISFNAEVDFLDADWPDTVDRGAVLSVTVRWQVSKSVRQARTFALHLVDDQGLLWGQTDEMSYLAEQWRPGDQVRQWLTLPVDSTTPAGAYALHLALTDEAAHPLPVLNQKGAPTGVWLNLGQITLTEAAGRIEPIGRGTPLGHSLQVLDHSRLMAPVTPGGQLTLSAVWQKTGTSVADQPVQIEIVGRRGETWFTSQKPIAGQYLPSAWQVGEVVRAQYTVTVPADALAGQSTVRLRRANAMLTLGQIDVQVEGRLFTLPHIQTPLHATFGESIELLGYDLPKTDFTTHEKVPLTLYWRARGSVDGDYKVFTHLLGPSGQVQGQKDSVPVDGTRPTAGWVEGEIVIDKYEIPFYPDALSGAYHIEIGLYDAKTIVRLPAFDAGGASLPHNRVLLLHELQVER